MLLDTSLNSGVAPVRVDVFCLSRPDRTVDVAMDSVSPDQVDEPIRLQHVFDVGLHARQSKLHTISFGQLVELGQLRGTLRVDEVHSL